MTIHAIIYKIKWLSVCEKIERQKTPKGHTHKRNRMNNAKWSVNKRIFRSLPILSQYRHRETTQHTKRTIGNYVWNKQAGNSSSD